MNKGNNKVKTIKIAFISLLMIVTCFAEGKAQDTSNEKTNAGGAQNGLFLSYGQAYNLKLDQTYSRLAKNGLNHLFYLGYRHLNDNRIIGAESSFMMGNLNTDGNDVNIINDYAGNLKVEYLRRIKKINVDHLSVYAGGNINFRGDFWFPGSSDLRYAWDFNLGAGLAAAAIYKFNPKLSIQYDLSVSLLGVLWRSHNNGQQLTTEEIQLEKGLIASAFETPRFSHTFNTLYLDNSFRLFYNFSNNVGIYYHFILSYRNIQQPLVKKGYESNNSIGLVFKF